MQVNFPNMADDQIEEHIDAQNLGSSTSSAIDFHNRGMRVSLRNTLRNGHRNNSPDSIHGSDLSRHQEELNILDHRLNVEERFLQRIRNQRQSLASTLRNSSLERTNSSSPMRQGTFIPERYPERFLDRRTKSEKLKIYSKLSKTIPKKWRIEELDQESVTNSSKSKLFHFLMCFKQTAC